MFDQMYGGWASMPEGGLANLPGRTRPVEDACEAERARAADAFDPEVGITTTSSPDGW